MNCFLNAHDLLIASSDAVLNNCLQQLSKYQSRVTDYRLIQESRFPNLSPPPVEEIVPFQLGFSRNKAISFDGFIDEWFRTTTRYDLLRGWWNDKILESLGDETFRGRLIPLNKVWPDIPKEGQFCPIVVVSPIIKWLETRFLQQIKLYMFETMDRQQTGFVNVCGTSVNI